MQATAATVVRAAHVNGLERSRPEIPETMRFAGGVRGCAGVSEIADAGCRGFGLARAKGTGRGTSLRG